VKNNLLITNAKLVTWEADNRILENHGLYIKDSKIQEIGPERELIERHPQDERIDAGGQYVMPGNICTHTHFYGAFARGLAIPGPAPKDFPEILRKLWWPLDKSLSLKDVRYSALVCLVDAIRHGTTTLIDHHASPNAIEGSLDVIAEAVESAGLRAALCYEVTDRDGEAKAQAGIQENTRFINRVKQERLADGRVGAAFGLHASLTLSDSTLEDCRQAVPEGVGFHIHGAEHEADQEDSLQKSGRRVVHRLQVHGILGPGTILAHAVHVDEREMEILADSGTWVTHQPRSNMNNGVGAAPIHDLLERGVKVGLGNDGFSNAMWEEWKAAYLMHKVVRRDPRAAQGGEVAKMAVYNNAALAGTFFPQAPLGLIAPGAYADLIFVDYQPHTPLTAGNLPWHIVFGFHESMITTTIVAGKVLMKDRQLLTLDAEEVAARARELAPGVWERYGRYAAAAA
jgi:putative selenium metabolism protein SsnA